MTEAATKGRSGLDDYAAPTSLEEAARLAADGPVTILAGGTDLMPQSEWGKAALEGRLLNIRRVSGLGGIEVGDDAIRLGALVTVTEILESAALARRAGVLVEAADQFASDQLRNMSSIGGNVCNASPAGDMIVPLLLLDAEAELVRWSGGGLEARRVALHRFFTGPGGTVRQSDEILTALHFATPPEGFVGGFRKFGPRPALEIAMAAVGISGVRDGKMLRHARVAFGAVAPTPMRGRATEAAIEGKTLDAAAISAAAETASREVSPITDMRASEWYRRHLVRVLSEELLSHAVDD
jgi:CO/xanthine dehydrogenase FAD-binding subunit